MTVLVTGRGTSGSWKIRGEQLGQAIGAHVEANALDVGGYRLAVLVKRAPADLLERLRAMDVPVVWDVVDAWPQPGGNDWDRAACMDWLRAQVAALRPAGIVAATRAMAQDCAEFGVPVLAVPHHAWPGQGLTEIRERVQVVGYQGAEHYLGSWRAVLDAECARRGWRFVVNPASVADLDIVVALRDSVGYGPRAWKSNVKLANAQGCGTPCILSREMGYMETACGAERWADDAPGLREAMDSLEDVHARREASAALQAAAPKLEDIAARYRTWLEGLYAAA